jgi:cysteine desulfurase
VNEPEIYLDWNATTPPLPEVLAAMSEAAHSAWGNPSSVHAAGRRARVWVEDAREELATLMGFSARDVLFTSGGTEANNLALANPAGIVTSRLEHPSVIRPTEAFASRGGHVAWLPLRSSGRVESEAVAEALKGAPRGSVVALMAANHETGVLQPIEEVAEICRRFGAHLHVDAVQALGKVDVSALRLADTVSVAGHKIRGPKGVGALLARPGWVPSPVLRGGGQERGLRPGTQDAMALAGFLAALHYARGGAQRYAALQPLRDRLEKETSAVAVANGAEAPRLPHVSNLSVRGFRGDELVAALDLDGVRVSSGSACSAGTTEPSEIITEMVGKERAQSAIRVSLGDTTQPIEIELAIAALFRVLGLQGSSG